jgi:HK97 family phage prohead protease
MEFRSLARTEFRVADEVKRQVEVIPITYDRLDSYHTVWERGVFADSIAKRAPRMCWGHDWRDPLGTMIDWQDGKEHPRALFQLDSFDDVPRARQAFAQIRSGTIDNFSVGFERIEDRAEEDSEKRWGVPDAVRILRATLDEVSPVLVGSVPGTATIGTRSTFTVDRSELLGLVRNLRDGEMTLDEALRVLHEVGDEHRLGMHKHAKQDGSGMVSHSHVNGMTTHAHSGLMPRLGMRSDEEQRAEWDTAYVNNLPDSAFAVILPGGKKDSDGKTVPRSLRKLPHHDADGSVDLPHLRNALARLPQTDLPAAAKEAADQHLDAHAQKAGVGTPSEEDEAAGRALERDISAALALVEGAL